MRNRGLIGKAMPFARGLVLAGIVAAGSFGLLDTLRPASASDRITAHVVAQLDRIGGVQGQMTIAGFRGVPVVCRAERRRSMILVGSDLALQLAGVHVRPVFGPLQDPLVQSAEASLSACPRLLANGLTARLFAGRQTLLRTVGEGGRTDYVFSASDYPHLPIVQLVVRREDLVPISVRYVSRKLEGYSTITAVSTRFGTSAGVASEQAAAAARAPRGALAGSPRSASGRAHRL